MVPNKNFLINPYYGGLEIIYSIAFCPEQLKINGLQHLYTYQIKLFLDHLKFMI